MHVAERGSSPLARGPLVQVDTDFFQGGLIPARAGTTGDFEAPLDSTGAHPRSRGDHQQYMTELTGLQGSSPLARGPRFNCRVNISPIGLIPARAGTTFHDGGEAATVGAHPRSRGDHLPPALNPHALGGSSPLARGPLNGPQLKNVAGGLIPARAGTTPTCRLFDLLGRAHPRSRGDHTYLPWSALASQGSSPLARGPPRSDPRQRAGPGLIPARAGNTWR